MSPLGASTKSESAVILEKEKRFEIRRVLATVRSAITGHAKLDELVLTAFGAQRRGDGRWRIGGNDDVYLHRDFTKVTQSIDAALAVGEEVLPGWSWSLLPMDATLWTSTDAVLQERLPRIKVTADAMTTPLAICAAALRAILALDSALVARKSEPV